MYRSAYLTASELLNGSCPDEGEQREHELQVRALTSACHARGLELCPVAWDDEGFVPSAFDAIVIGSAWDYAARPVAFLRRLARGAAQRPLFNPIETVRWNVEKTYLRELAERGAPVIPTLWRTSADERSLRAAFDELATDRIVVKPTIGQTSWRQVLLARGDELPPSEQLPPQAAMIQPYLPSIQTEGEQSFIFIDGEFSHCVQKLPAVGDYRTQGNFGGRDCAHVPERADLLQAQSVIEALGQKLLYARIDLVRGPGGGLVLMECELIEPYLYPERSTDVGERFAAALVRRLARER